MKLNNQFFLSTILICFALVGKCMSHVPPAPDSSSASATPTPSSSSSSSSSSPPQNEGRKTKTTSPPITSQFTDSPYTVTPSDAPSPTSDDGYGHSSSFNAYYSDYLKRTFSSHSKTKYNHGLVQICGHTHHPDVCLTTISPLLKHKFDAIHVLEAAITVCTHHIKMTIAGIERHVAASHAIAAALIDCKSHYAKALVNLHRAIEAIHAKKFGIVTIMLSGCLADVSSAESKIEDLKSVHLKVRYYSFVSVTASNCLSIASLIPN